MSGNDGGQGMRIGKRVRLALAGAAISAGVLGGGYAAGSAAHAGAQSLVYICPSVVGAVPQCMYNQEFQIADHNGWPIFNVGEYGGAAVTGDNLRVDRTITSGGVTISPWSPKDYYAAQIPPVLVVPACKAPVLWIAPTGEWACSLRGTWVQVQSIPVPRG